MTIENFFSQYWIVILIGILAIIILGILLSWILNKTQKQNKIKPSKEINKIIVEIRKELRAEHKRLTTLFKDLDDFLEQLPPYFNSLEPETKEFKKLNDYQDK